MSQNKDNKEKFINPRQPGQSGQAGQPGQNRADVSQDRARKEGYNPKRDVPRK